MDQDRTKRKLTAIFSTDVVGYSRLMEEDEAWTIQNLEENKRLISKLIEEYQGRVIDSPGDNLLAEFNSVINAVECAVKIQQELKKKNDNLIEPRRMHFRIGVNLGDVVEEDGRIYGNGVNIAARLEGLTDPGGICISRRTYDHVKTRLDLGYEYLGEHNVKNISEPVRVYRVLMGAENAGKVVGEKKVSKRVSRRLAMTTIIALIIIAAGSLIWNIFSNQSRTIEQASEPTQAPAVVDVKKAPKTIAVLPFLNLSSDPEQEYFVDGLSEEILNNLAQLPELRVTSRTSSFSFKGTDKKIQEIANELGVAHVLEGSVRKAGNALRITAQLIRATDDFHLWSKTYDRELKDIFVVQEDIARAVANELKISLNIDKSLKLVGGTDNPEVYELYLVARGQKNAYEYDLALNSIDAAIEIDPEFALAWAYKSLIHARFVAFGPSNRAGSEKNSTLTASMRAIALEPEMGQAYLSLGSAYMTRGEFIDAELAYRKGVALTGKSIDLNEYGFAWRYSLVGYLEKWNEINAQLRPVDPLNSDLRGDYILSTGMIGNIQKAEEEYERDRARFGSKNVWPDTAITNIRFGAGGAVSQYEIPIVKELGPIWSLAWENLESPTEALKKLRQYCSDKDIRTSADFMHVSLLAAYFGDYDFAMEAAEEGFRIDGTGLFAIWFPVMQKVRQLTRFKEFVREIGLVDYWEKFGWPDLCRPLDNGDFVCD